MSDFLYTAVDKEGKHTTGKIEAANFLAAGHMLKEQGLVPMDIHEQTSINWSAYFSGFISVGLKEKIAAVSEYYQEQIRQNMPKALR